MKKLCLLVVVVLTLTGCGKQENFETMSDQYEMPESAQAQQTSMILQQEAVSVGLETGEETIYICDDFCAMVQTFSAGDLDATIRSITGYPKEKLMVMQHTTDGITSYECVWASAGEGGDQVGRCLILDDGNHHYALSVMADAATAGQLTETWQLLFDSFAIGQPESTKG